MWFYSCLIIVNYVFLLLWLCTLIVCLCIATLTEVFPCFFLSCKANARVNPTKTGHGPHSSLFLCCSMYFCVVLCIFVLFYVFLCCSMYCLFCVVLCIVCVCVCVYMCTELLPLGGYPIAVKYIISYHIITYHIISYHIISYHIISYHIISYHIISYHISYHIIYRVLTVAGSHHLSLPVKVLTAVHPNVTRHVSSNRVNSRHGTCANRVKKPQATVAIWAISPRKLSDWPAQQTDVPASRAGHEIKLLNVHTHVSTVVHKPYRTHRTAWVNFCKWVPAWGANWINRPPRSFCLAMKFGFIAVDWPMMCYECNWYYWEYFVSRTINSHRYVTFRYHF